MPLQDRCACYSRTENLRTKVPASVMPGVLDPRLSRDLWLNRWVPRSGVLASLNAGGKRVSGDHGGAGVKSCTNTSEVGPEIGDSRDATLIGVQVPAKAIRAHRQARAERRGSRRSVGPIGRRVHRGT